MTGNKREDLRINVNEDQECRNWAEKFGVTADELKRAVYKYGVLADDVARLVASRRVHHLPAGLVVSIT